MTTMISGSILSASLLNLKPTLDSLTAANVNRLHYDVMDGHFVPNLSFGPALLKQIKTHYPHFTIDTHLMTFPNENMIQSFVDAGTDSIILHYEAADNIQYWLDQIPKDIKLGLAIKPGPIPEPFFELTEQLDIVLVMSVEPGFGGQSFITSQLEILSQLSQYKQTHDCKFVLGVDGGVTLSMANKVRQSGANLVIIGKDLVGNPDKIKEKANEYRHLLV
tara:strand:- start:613 stop:1272 length:660 start_codon:yes stop_codon:yes gene_type:complete